VVDRVLQFILVAMAPRSDGLPGGISHIITDRCSEGWPLVPAEDPEFGEDLCNCLEFHPPWTRDSLDPLGVEVMPKCPSRARNMPVGIRASASKDSLLSASLYNFSPSMALRREYYSSSSSSLLTSWSSSYCCSSAGAP
jgi:hypothetical protein